MEAFWRGWQQLPQYLEPVAFTVWSVPVYWYALFFLLGSFFVYYLVKRELLLKNICTKKEAADLGFGVFISALVGAKIGFLFFYWYPFVNLTDTSVLPGTKESIIALPGMSFFGGMVGVTLFLFWYARKYKKTFFILTDTLVVFLPIAIFFGRLGNFFHNELWGRITTTQWGMYFPGEQVLRHPSTSYAAFLEGFFLFSILFFLRKKNMRKELNVGILTAWFCVGYGALRFVSEHFREPDMQIGLIGSFTLNQIFASLIFLFGIGIYFFFKKSRVFIGRK